MKFLKLIKIVVFRNIREEKFLTTLSIIGVALGIGLFVGIKVASDRAVASFEADIQGINPYANYEIVDISGIDFNEDVYRDVRNLEENTFPVLKTFGYIPEIKETIDITGIYTVKFVRFLNLPQNNSPPLSKGGMGGLDKRYDFENFYIEQNGVIITKKFSDRYSFKNGDTLKTFVYDKEYSLKIVDVIDTEMIPANTMVMDIGNYQEYFHKVGYLTRIDLATDGKKAEEIRKILPAYLTIEEKEEVFKNKKSLVASFRYNLQFVSLISILVGMFLLYNTIFISVVKRRTEIGVLRSLGADRKTVIMLFTIQGMVLGCIGSILGIILGQIVAYFSVFAVEKTISTMYSTISISDYVMTKGETLGALILGLFVSLLASAIPSFESSRISPDESTREGSFEDKYKRYQKVFSSIGVLCIVSGAVWSYVDYRYTPFEFPFLAYVGILLIIIGFTFISPSYLSVILKIIKKPSEKIFKATGKITIGDMRGNIYRFSVALMSVAISSALIIAFLTLIFSFRNSLNGWIKSNITADVYIKPLSCKSNYCFYPLSDEIYTIAKSFPEVVSVAKFRTLQLELFDKKVIGAFADISVKRIYSDIKYFDTQQAERLKEMEDGKVVGISDYLSIKYGLQRGDPIKLKTPKGEETFTINDIFSSYSTTSGFIYIDRRWLREYWGLDDATQISIYTQKGTDIKQFIHKLKERLSPDYSLEIMNNQELREKVINIFNKSFAITYAIELISIIVSLIGVVNTLLALVFERKREISIIRYLGGSWKQIGHTFTLSASIVGITGIFLGTIMGPLMSIIFIHVVNKISFGWEIHFKIPFLYLSFVTLILFLTTVTAGFIPSKVARKIDPKRFISFE
ncbi:MAG: FtsX-like permease family protein [Nitrospira sp.]|nr:FtsX-like permease family protein [Nitrospira sp.]